MEGNPLHSSHSEDIASPVVRIKETFEIESNESTNEWNNRNQTKNRFYSFQLLHISAVIVIVFCIIFPPIMVWYFQSCNQSTYITSSASSSATSSPLNYQKWSGQRVMFIYAHIDDMEASSGGLVALLKGIAEIYILVITNGDKGCGNTELCGNSTNSELTQIRQGEQYNSAAILGFPNENIIFLNYEDCLLDTYGTGEVEYVIVGYVRKYKPHVVITWDPVAKFDMVPSEGWDDMGYHPDHQTSGNLALNSVWNAQLSRLWPEQGYWKISELYFWAFTPTKVPDFYVDVTGAPYETKTKSFLAMQSQYAYNDSASMITFLDFMGNQSAALVGLPQGRKSEGYNYILW